MKVKKGTEGTTISWATSNSNVITSYGAVSRQSTNVNVTLTATISRGNESDTKEFIITVYGTQDADEQAVNDAKSDLNLSTVLNGNSDKENIIAGLYLPTSLTGHTGVVITWNTTNLTRINNTGGVNRSSSQDTRVNVTANLTKNTKSTTKLFTLLVKKKVAPIVQTEINTTLGQTEIVIDQTNGNTVQEINVPDTVEDDEPVVLNFESTINTTGSTRSVTLPNELNLSRKTTTANYSVKIPASTQVQGPENWNGIVQIPTVVQKTQVTAPSVPGKDTSVETVIEVGVPNVRLNFTNPIRILLEGMTGKKAAFSIAGDQLIKITTACSDENGTGIPANGECYYDDGTDLIIWTYHFTKFSAYTETDSATPSSGSGSSGDEPEDGTGATTDEVPEPILPSTFEDNEAPVQGETAQDEGATERVEEDTKKDTPPEQTPPEEKEGINWGGVLLFLLVFIVVAAVLIYLIVRKQE